MSPCRSEAWRPPCAPPSWTWFSRTNQKAFSSQWRRWVCTRPTPVPLYRLGVGSPPTPPPSRPLWACSFTIGRWGRPPALIELTAAVLIPPPPSVRGEGLPGALQGPPSTGRSHGAGEPAGLTVLRNTLRRPGSTQTRHGTPQQNEIPVFPAFLFPPAPHVVVVVVVSRLVQRWRCTDCD